MVPLETTTTLAWQTSVRRDTTTREIVLQPGEHLEARDLFDASGAFVRSEVPTQQAVEPPILYVSTSGSDSNSGASVVQSFRTINKATQSSVPGTTILVMPGVYPEYLSDIPGGDSWNAPVRIAAYDPTNRPIIRPHAGQPRVFTFSSPNSKYIEIDGFELDAINVTYDAVKITSGPAGAAHHIRIKNTEIKNSPNQGVLVSGSGADYNEFQAVDIHNNGVTRFDHAFYIQTSYNLVENSTIHNNSGWGIHNYGGNPSHNVYRDNIVIDNNSVAQDAVGIGIYTGTNIVVQGNRVSGRHYTGIAVDYSARNILVQDNVVTANSVVGVYVGPNVAGNFQLAGSEIYGQPINLHLSTQTSGGARTDLEIGSVDGHDALTAGSASTDCQDQVQVQGAVVQYFVHCSSNASTLASFPDGLEAGNFDDSESDAIESAFDEYLRDHQDVTEEDLLASLGAALDELGVSMADRELAIASFDLDALNMLIAAGSEDLRQALAEAHAATNAQN